MELKMIKKGLVIIIMLSFCSLRAVDVCRSFNMLVKKDPFDGIKVYDFILDAGAQVFAGKKGRDGINSLLQDDPEVAPLKQTNSKIWNELNECLSDYLDTLWIQLGKSNQKKLVDPTLQTAESQPGIINQVNADLPYYSKILTIMYNEKSLKKLKDQINALTQLYIYSLNRLSQLTWSTKVPADLVEIYNENFLKPFDPKQFLDAYKNLKKIGEELKTKKNLTEDLYRIFVFNEFLIPYHLRFFNETHLTQKSGAERWLLKVTMFLDFLEELVYQSKNYKPKYFWSSKPKDLLSKDQQALAQEIIEIVYALYPGCETNAIMKRIARVTSQNYRIPLVVFAQAKTLLIVLRAYLRKVSVEKTKK